jgi:hypothetical protein
VIGENLRTFEKGSDNSIALSFFRGFIVEKSEGLLIHSSARGKSQRGSYTGSCSGRYANPSARAGAVQRPRRRHAAYGATETPDGVKEREPDEDGKIWHRDAEGTPQMTTG